MTNAVEIALKNLNYQYWITEQDGDFKQYRLTVMGKNGVMDCYISIVYEENQISLTFPVHASIPEKCQAEVLQYVSLINSSSVRGKYVYNTNQFLFSYVAEIQLTSLNFDVEETFTTLLNEGFETIERYALGFMKIAFGNAKEQQEFYLSNNLIDPTWN